MNYVPFSLVYSKVRIFWEGPKILRNLYLTFDWPYHRTKVRWRLCKILWPSQNIWTYVIAIYFNFKFFVSNKTFLFVWKRNKTFKKVVKIKLNCPCPEAKKSYRIGIFLQFVKGSFENSLLVGNGISKVFLDHWNNFFHSSSHQFC